MKRGVGIVAVLSVLGAIVVANPAYAEEGCPDYFFIGARGTNAPLLPGPGPDGNLNMGPEAYQLFTTLTEWDDDEDEYVLSNSATVLPVGLAYDASGDILHSVARGVPSDGYKTSVEEGGEMVEDIINSSFAFCEESQFILAGYSQGADAIAEGIYALGEDESAAIAVTVLYGDPKFNSSDFVADRGSYSRTHGGLFGTRPAWSFHLDSPVFSYCRYADLVCNSYKAGTYKSQHTRTYDAEFVNKYAWSHHGGSPLGAHEQYAPQQDPKASATAVQRTLQLPCDDLVQGGNATLSGPSTLHVGETARFSAIGSQLDECISYSWEYWVSRGGTTNQLLSPFSLLAEEPEEPQEPEPAGIEPHFDKEFDLPGTYEVSVLVETEHGTMTASRSVEVLPEESAVPSLPLLSRSSTAEGDLLLSWTNGGDKPADFFVVTDPEGDVFAAVRPFEEAGLDGEENFEFVVSDLGENDSRDYSVTGVNAVGETDSRLLLEASSAAYSHRILSGATPIGGTFALSGLTTPELEDAEAESLVSPIVPIDGSYEARLIASASEIGIDMSEITAELTVDEGEWELEFDFGDDLDVDDYPITQSMRGGFADALLEDGLITLEIDGVDFVVSINEDTETEQVNKYVVNTNATVPDGIDTDDYFGSATSGHVQLTHDGAYDTADFPAWDESLDPLAHDWATAVASDIHVYIGNDEVVHTGEVSVYALGDPTSTADATVDFALWGSIGDGSYLTMRDFLEDGAVSFRLDGGEPNVIELDASSQLAQELYPEPIGPVFLGGYDVVVDEGTEVLWEPSIDWSVWGGGAVEISADVLPAGMQIEWWGALTGVPAESGVYPFTVTAINESGTTAREYELTVKSRDLPATEAVYEHRIWPGGVADNGELTLSGTVNERLDGILAENPGTPSLLGEYEAAFIPVNGDPMNYDMSAADVDFESDGDTWEATFAFGDDLDTGDLVIWERMRHGLAGQLLAGSTICVQIEGTPINLVINNVTTTDENNRWVVDPSPIVPNGVSGDEYYGSLEFDSVEFLQDGSYDPLLFPAGVGLDPVEHTYWPSSEISDVHVYIGSREIAFNGELEAWVLAPTSASDDSIDVSLTGQVGDGSHLTYRSLLMDGAVSFRVNSGDLNVIEFDATSTEAEASFPTPTAPEILGGTVTMAQFDHASWEPWISWGGVAPGTYTITSNDLPMGMGIWNTYNNVLGLGGVILQQGEFTFEVSATNEVGTTTRQMTLEVGPSVAKEHYHDGAGTLTRNSNGNLTVMLRNPYDAVYRDNATIAEWMPAVDEAGLGLIGESGYEQFTATDVHLYLASGAEIPITGTFTVEIMTGSHIELTSTNMTIGDNTTTTINSVWKQAVRMTFQRSAGEVNEFWKSARPWYSLT